MKPQTRSSHVASGTWLLLCLLFLARPLASRADQAKRELYLDATLAQLIDESLATVPELASAQDVVRAEEERIPQASAWPNPMLQIGIQNMGFTSIEIGRDPMSFVSVMASQTVPWPGKLGLRRDVAQISASQAKKSVDRVRLSTEADVRRAYLDLLLVRTRMALLDHLDNVWQRTLAVARAKYESGGGSQSELLRAQLEMSRIQQRRIALQGQEQIAVQALNRLRGHPLDEPIVTPTRIQDLPAPRSLEEHFTAAEALADSPELQFARLNVSRASKSIDLSEKSYYPDLTVAAGLMVRGGLPPMWLVTVGGPLPLSSDAKQSRAIAENRALASAARNQVKSVEQLLRLRSEERHAVYTSLLQTIDLYERGLLVESKATMESTLAQYQVGKVGFGSVLEASAGFIADEERHLQAIAAAHRIVIEERELSLSAVFMPEMSGNVTSAMPGAGSASMTSASASSGAGPEALPETQPGGGDMSTM